MGGMTDTIVCLKNLKERIGVYCGPYDTDYMKTVKRLIDDAIAEAEHDLPRPPCPSCDGEGRVEILNDDDLVLKTIPCPDCDGSGVTKSEPMPPKKVEGLGLCVAACTSRTCKLLKDKLTPFDFCKSKNCPIGPDYYNKCYGGLGGLPANKIKPVIVGKTDSKGACE